MQIKTLLYITLLSLVLSSCGKNKEEDCLTKQDEEKRNECIDRMKERGEVLVPTKNPKKWKF